MTVDRFPVEESHIMMFARAVGDPNPVYDSPAAAADTELGRMVAPPTFVQASAQFDPDYALRPKIGKPWFGSGSTPTGAVSGGGESGDDSTRAEAGGNKGTLHAEQHFEYHRHVGPGDVLTATTRPGETWEKQSKRAGTLRFSESITEYRDQKGELVITARGIGVRTERPVES